MKKTFAVVVSIFLCLSASFGARVYTSGFNQWGRSWDQTTGAYDSAKFAGMIPDGTRLAAYGQGWWSPGYSVVRSGQGALSLQASAGSGHQIFNVALPIASARFYFRGYIWLYDAGGVENNAIIAFYNGGTVIVQLKTLTNGKIVLAVNGVNKDTTVNGYENLNKDYKLVKIYSNLKDTTIAYFGSDSLEAKGVSVTAPGRINGAEIGWGLGSVSTAGIIYIDDFALNDTTGSYENYWPDDTAHVVDLVPVSDNSIGNWIGGAGGITNLYDGVNNIPPIGNTTETNLTNIKNSTSGASDNYDANMTDYTTAGIPSGSAIRVLQGYVRHGEHSATGTDSGAVKIVSNPPSPSEFTFIYGSDLGAHGRDAVPTYNWRTSLTPPIYGDTANANIVRGTSPVFRVGRRANNTNQVCVDQMGIMVEYGSAYPTPPAGSGKYRRHR